MTPEPLKPWPRDAVMIVAAFPDEARRDQMESCHAGTCRDCGREILYDGFSYHRAQQFTRLKANVVRPIKFFCVECAVKYDMQHFDHFEDHRGRKPCNKN
jgi:hypothetical protein